MKSITSSKAIRETATKGLTLVQPPKEGVARAAAEKNKKPRVTRRSSHQTPKAITSVEEASLVLAPPAKLPEVQSLMALTTEQGLLVLFGCPPEASLISRVGLAQSLPQPWILPADETKRLIQHDLVTVKEGQQARIYLAFVPLVALGPADMLSGQQQFGAEVEGLGLMTFSADCTPYNKADPRRLANMVLRFPALFAGVVSRRFETEHALRKGIERLQQEAEQRLHQRQQAQEIQSTLSHIQTADVTELEREFLLNPDRPQLAAGFAERIRPADVPEAMRELADETALLERVIAAGERIRQRELS